MVTKFVTVRQTGRWTDRQIKAKTMPPIPYWDRGKNKQKVCV